MNCMIEFPAENLIGRRADRRRSIRMPARIIVEHSELEGIIVDLSETGARIEHSHFNKLGETAVLVIGKDRLQIEIVWQVAQSLGVRFLIRQDSAAITQLAKIAGRTLRVIRPGETHP